MTDTELQVRIHRKVYPLGSGDGNRLAIEDLAFDTPAGQCLCGVLFVQGRRG